MSDLGDRERLKLLRLRLGVRPGIDRRVAGDVLPADGGVEALAQRERQPSGSAMSALATNSCPDSLSQSDIAMRLDSDTQRLPKPVRSAVGRREQGGEARSRHWPPGSWRGGAGPPLRMECRHTDVRTQRNRRECIHIRPRSLLRLVDLDQVRIRRAACIRLDGVDAQRGPRVPGIHLIFVAAAVARPPACRCSRKR